MACENCNVWQHSQCLGIRRVEAEKDNFHFVCNDCNQKIADARRPNIKLKFRAGLSASPPQAREPRAADSSSPMMKFKAIEIPAQGLQTARPPNQGLSSDTPIEFSRPMANGVSPSPYLQHAASSTLNGHSAHRASQSPHKRPTSSSTYLNGSLKTHATYSSPLNAPHHPSAGSSVYTNGHASNSIQVPPQQARGGRPESEYGTNQYPQNGVSQPQGISERACPPTNSTPIARPTPNHNQYGPLATPLPQPQCRLPSPVLNRPSMSPTQGNPDVGPVAGVPQWCEVGNALSAPPYPATVSESQNGSATPPFTNHLTTPQLNGDRSTQSRAASISQHQHQPLSGLSPTKHSPALQQNPRPSTSHTTSSPSPHLASVSVSASAVSGGGSGSGGGRRSISGTPIFPPTEMLQPSPKQLSRSPVPTPSKVSTPAGVRESELRRVGEDRGRVQVDR